MAEGRPSGPGRTAADLRRIYGAVRNLVASPDGRRLAAGTRNQELVLIDARTGASERVVRVSGESNIGMEDRLPVAFTPDGRAVVTAGADGMLRLWDASTGSALASHRAHECPIGALAVGRSGRAVTGADDTTALVW